MLNTQPISMQSVDETSLDHERGRQPYRAERSPEENASYCSGAIMRIADIASAWSRISGTGREHIGGRE